LLGYRFRVQFLFNHGKKNQRRQLDDARHQEKTKSKFSSEEKIRIILDGLRGEESIAALCRREGIAQILYYRWSKDFLEAGKKRLSGDTVREANSSEVQELKGENAQSSVPFVATKASLFLPLSFSNPSTIMNF